MPRLKFDLKPIDRNEDYWQSREEHEAWVQKIWTIWERSGKPAPCDCGFYSDGWLTTCDANDRRRCRSGVEKRLDSYYRREHLSALAEKRKFPDNPPAPGGVCRWCRGPIVHGRVKQRGSHDGRMDEPDCKQAYLLHTDLDVQRAHLLKRDGPGCAECGAIAGRWQMVWLCQEHVAEGYGYEGATSVIRWTTGHEVDHFIALATAWEAFGQDQRWRWFFSPANLRLLCDTCHKVKTRADVALMKEIRTMDPEAGRVRIIEILANAGLLKTSA